MHTPEPRLPGISVREAAIRLGTSESDVRRRIRRGELRAESLARPGGTLLRVMLDEPEPRHPIESDAAPDTLQAAPVLTLGLLARVTELSDRVSELEREAGRLEGQVIAATVERDAARQAAEAARAEAAELRAERDALKQRGWWARIWNR